MPDQADPRPVSGLSELAPSYRGLLCDVWGVLHNGEAAWPAAAGALAEFRRAGGSVILLTNAARRTATVIDQLDRLGLPRASYDDVVSSGEATRRLLAERGRLRVCHVGTEIHRQLYEGLPVDVVDEAECEVVVCAALFDTRETPDDYRDRLERWRARSLPMICANPDVIAHHGERLVWCAGALARDYLAMGGEVEMVGKPHAGVYEFAFRRLAEVGGRPPGRDGVLMVGDNIETDLRGAAGQGIDAVLITSGVHAADFGPADAPDAKAVAARLAGAGVRARGFMPRLVW